GRDDDRQRARDRYARAAGRHAARHRAQQGRRHAGGNNPLKPRTFWTLRLSVLEATPLRSGLLRLFVLVAAPLRSGGCASSFWWLRLFVLDAAPLRSNVRTISEAPERSAKATRTISDSHQNDQR